MKPIIYYDNLFSRVGSLTGTLDGVSNPVRRIADGSISLRYIVASGLTPSGEVQVTLNTVAAPDALVLGKGTVASGHRFILESEDVGGGNNATILDFTITSGVDRFVREISGATPRAVWRLTVSGTLSGADMTANEFTLATKLELPRSPQVGVERGRVRQFTRIPLPDGQPFVKREGPRLRRNSYTMMIVSGAELNGVEVWVDAIDGGESFYLKDDRGEEYWAEVPVAVVSFSDSAGVDTLNITFQEVDID